MLTLKMTVRGSTNEDPWAGNGVEPRGDRLNHDHESRDTGEDPRDIPRYSDAVPAG